MIKKVLPLLILPLLAYPRVIVLQKGDTLTNLLQEYRYVPIYGKGNYLERCLKLNNLSLDSARELKIGTEVILALSEERNKKQSTQTQPKTKKNDNFSYQIKLGSSSFQFIDTNNNQATFNTQYQFSLGFNFEKNISHNTDLLSEITFQHSSLRQSSEVNFSNNHFNLWKIYFSYKRKINDKSLRAALGLEQFFLPISNNSSSIDFTTGQSFALKMGIDFLQNLPEYSLDLLYFFPSKNPDIKLKQTYRIALSFLVPQKIKNSQIKWGGEFQYRQLTTNITRGDILGLFFKLKL